MSLLVLVVVVAVPCSWLATEMRRAERQKEIVQAIGGPGESVRYDNGLVDNTITTGKQPPWRQFLKSLLGDDFFANVDTVTISRENDLKHVKGLSRLRLLVVTSCPTISDEGLRQVGELTQLCALYLDGETGTDTARETPDEVDATARTDSYRW